jgi:hypothetical protein
MPNWCVNRLTVSNKTPEFTAFLKENGLNFKKIAPPSYPEKLDNSGCAIINSQIYAWGTKWDLSESEAKESAEFIMEYDYADFDTAWSPPINAIEALSKMFPEVSFTLSYYEPGMCFYGTANFFDGVTSDDCRNVEDKEEYAAFLVEEFGFDEEDARDQAGLNDDDEEEE